MLELPTSDTNYFYIYPKDYTSDTYIDQGYWCAFLDTVKDDNLTDRTVECFYK